MHQVRSRHFACLFSTRDTSNWLLLLLVSVGGTAATSAKLHACGLHVLLSEHLARRYRVSISLAWKAGPVGRPVGEPPAGSRLMPKVAASTVARSYLASVRCVLASLASIRPSDRGASPIFSEAIQS